LIRNATEARGKALALDERFSEPWTLFDEEVEERERVRVKRRRESKLNLRRMKGRTGCEKLICVVRV